MKKTTYILLGMVMAGFGAIALVAGLAWMFSEPAASRHWVLCEDIASMEIPSCKVLRFESSGLCANSSDSGVRTHSRVYFERSQLDVVPSEATSGRFTFSADLLPFLSLQQSGDTCTVLLKLTEQVRQQYSQSDYEFMFMQLGRMQLQLPHMVQHFAMNWNSLDTHIDSLQCDTLLLEGSGTFNIRQCRFGTLQLEANRIFLNSASVDSVKVDLDRVYEWNVEADSCRIGVELLSGSGSHHCLLQKGESEELRWEPKTEQAVLEIRVDQPVLLKPLDE